MSDIVAELEDRRAGRRWQPSSEVAEASVMLDLFQGLGVESFSLTLTDDTGRKVAFRRNKSVELLRRELPCLLFTACENRLNVIVRPIAARRLSLIQLDDLSASQLDRVCGFSFLVLETSPENFQAWVAVTDASPETIRRVKRAAGADLNASGATRLGGSYNFKSKYAPNYPRVRLHSVAPLHAVTARELERASLVAPEEHTPRAPRHAPTHRRRDRLLVWPATRVVWLMRPAQEITRTKIAARQISTSASSLLIEAGPLKLPQTSSWLKARRRSPPDTTTHCLLLGERLPSLAAIVVERIFELSKI